MSNVFLNGNRAVKVNAAQVPWGYSDKAILYDIDGYQRWVSKRYSKFYKTGETDKGWDKGELLIEEWLYNKIFHDEA
ncbi:MAG: hypothetical protein ACOC2U_00140 [bacterium]